MKTSVVLFSIAFLIACSSVGVRSMTKCDFAAEKFMGVTYYELITCSDGEIELTNERAHDAVHDSIKEDSDEK